MFYPLEDEKPFESSQDVHRVKPEDVMHKSADAPVPLRFSQSRFSDELASKETTETVLLQLNMQTQQTERQTDQPSHSQPGPSIRPHHRL